MKLSKFGYWESAEINQFYDEKLCLSIADLFKKYDILNVYDFGCGEGKYVQFLRKMNFNCLGYDGNPYTSTIAESSCSVINLAEHFNLPNKVEAVISLEVGEHIPKEYESVFLNNISSHAISLVVLSWAVIGQPGIGHINCQNNEYVINEMRNRNFTYNHEESIKLRDSSILCWFKNTIMVFENASRQKISFNK
jgi:hypothetical protein